VQFSDQIVLGTKSCEKIFSSKHELILEKYFNVFKNVFEKSNTLIMENSNTWKKVFKYFQTQMSVFYCINYFNTSMLPIGSSLPFWAVNLRLSASYV